MNFNRIEVKKFRLPCSKQAGVYRWWFPEEIAKSLLSALNGVDYESIEKEEINDKQYWCLYIGSSSDLEQRFYWHTTQAHSTTAIKNSALSTLRQTICALLKINQSDATAKQKVDDILDECYCEWYATSSSEDPETIEKKELKKGYYPLNIQNNEGVRNKHKNMKPSIPTQLTKLRREYRK